MVIEVKKNEAEGSTVGKFSDVMCYWIVKNEESEDVADSGFMLNITFSTPFYAREDVTGKQSMLSSIKFPISAVDCVAVLSN